MWRSSPMRKDRECVMTGNSHKIDEMPFDFSSQIGECDVVVKASYGTVDGVELSLVGFIGSLDAAKQSATPEIISLRAAGVRVVILRVTSFTPCEKYAR